MYKDTLTNNLRKISRNDPFINEINGSIGLSLDNFGASITDFTNQIDISKATWSLPIYEKELGITIDISKSDAARREQIVSRLRGTGKIGAAEIKLIADSYTNGDVEITLDHGIAIQFSSVTGTPSNLDDLKTVIRTVTPAHLTIKYKFRYLLINEIHNIMTIDELQSTLLSKFAGRGV